MEIYNQCVVYTLRPDKWTRKVSPIFIFDNGFADKTDHLIERQKYALQIFRHNNDKTASRNKKDISIILDGVTRAQSALLCVSLLKCLQINVYEHSPEDFKDLSVF